MSSYGRNFSTRLFIQAAFTGLLAPLGSRSSTWLMGTFAIAAGAAVIGAMVRNGHERTRELVIGFEAVAVAVGGVGLAGGHYIPGTIVGIAALITAVQHPMPRAVAVPPQAMPDAAAPFAAPQYPAGQFPAPQLPAAQYAAPQPPQPVVAADCTAPEPAPAPVLDSPVVPVTGVRAMNILPGR